MVTFSLETKNTALILKGFVVVTLFCLVFIFMCHTKKQINDKYTNFYPKLRINVNDYINSIDDLQSPISNNFVMKNMKCKQINEDIRSFALKSNSKLDESKLKTIKETKALMRKCNKSKALCRSENYNKLVDHKDKIIETNVCDKLFEKTSKDAKLYFKKEHVDNLKPVYYLKKFGSKNLI